MNKAMKQAIKTKTLKVRSISLEGLNKAIMLGFIVVFLK